MNNLVGFVRLVIASFCLLMVETGWTETETVNGIVWNYTISGGGAELGRYAIPQTTSGHVDIPSKLGGHSVTRIGDYAFYDCQSITTVAIPDSVTEIGNYAFAYCSGLSSVTIPRSCRRIGDWAFWCCRNLTSITLPKSLKSIGAGGLGYCGIQRLVLPSTDVKLGERCFDGSCLTSLPENLTEIPVRAFGDCCDLTTIDIPATVKEIPDNAFWYSGLIEVTIPEGVERIGYRSFSSCRNLKSVSIPSSVKIIESCAFDECRKLESLNLSDGIEVVEYDAFYSCSSLRELYIPPSVTSLGNQAFANCTALVNVVIDGKIESLEAGTFANCSNLKSVTLPESLVSLRDYSGDYSYHPFYMCNRIEDVYFKGGVPSFDGTFSGNAQGHFLQKHANEWMSVIDPVTKMWHGLQMKMPTYSVIYDANGGGGSTNRQVCEFGSDGVLVDDGGNLHWEGHYFVGWAFAPDGEVAYKAGDYVAEPTEGDVVTLYAKWTDCVVHFKANGGVFRGKDGRVVKEFDQYFVYGEPQKLFTDDLVPMRMDGNGNEFLGWVRGTPEITSSDDLIDDGKVWTWNDDVTEETFYAVWTTTLKVMFYNNDDKRNAALLPASLADHLTWSVEGESRTHKSGESIEVGPGTRKIKLQVDGDYVWIAGVFDLGDDNAQFNAGQDVLTLNVRNDCTDSLIWSTPCQNTRNVYVKVNPLFPDETGRVRFVCVPEIRESLSDRIKMEDVPFDELKVHIALEEVRPDEDGNLVEIPAHLLVDLRPSETYVLPKSRYVLKSVSYDADWSSGDPYWGAVLWVNLKGRSFDVEDGSFKEIPIDFDMFGGDYAVKVEFDPQGGKCAKSSMWFTYPRDAGVYGGSAKIDKKLPKAEKAGFGFEGWFTAKSGGKKMEFGDAIIDCALYAHWKTKVTEDWLLLFPELAARAKGDVETAASLTAANGCRTVGECYELGINPEDPNDDFKIVGFEMKDGKPVISLNHTEDGFGNSFVSRVKMLGKANLSDGEWREVPETGDGALRFFKVTVESP